MHAPEDPIEITREPMTFATSSCREGWVARNRIKPGLAITEPVDPDTDDHYTWFKTWASHVIG